MSMAMKNGSIITLLVIANLLTFIVILFILKENAKCGELLNTEMMARNLFDTLQSTKSAQKGMVNANIQGMNFDMHASESMAVYNFTQNYTGQRTMTYTTSLRESFDFLSYSNEDWQRKKDIHNWQSKRQHGKQHSEGKKFYQENWEPTWSCGYEKRIGKIGDGGKWVCEAYLIAEATNCNVISIGSANDWSFENAIHELNPKCKIFTFDHTITPKDKPDFVQFHALGLGPTVQGNIGTMNYLLQTAGLSDKVVDILKIDCEGCEWQIYHEFFSGFIRQILIELHGVGPMHRSNEFFKAMDKNGYVIFHKEPNTLGCSGDCIEYAFLKLNLPQNAHKNIAGYQKQGKVFHIPNNQKNIRTKPQYNSVLPSTPSVRKKVFRIYMDGEPGGSLRAKNLAEKYDMVFATELARENPLRNVFFCNFILWEQNAWPYKEEYRKINIRKNIVMPSSVRPIDILYTSSNCDSQREATVQAVREAVESSGLRFEYNGKCSAGSSKKRYDAKSDAAKKAKMMIAISRSQDTNSEALDEKLLKPMEYGAIPVYKGNGERLAKTQGYPSTYLSWNNYSSNEKFADAVVKLALNSIKLDKIQHKMITHQWSLPNCLAARNYVNSKASIWLKNKQKVITISPVTNGRKQISKTNLFWKIVKCIFLDLSSSANLKLELGMPGESDVEIHNCCW